MPAAKHASGGHKFLERKKGGHKIFDDQNAVTEVFILFKKTDFNTILACLGGKVYRWWGVTKSLLLKWGAAILLMPTICKFGTPLAKKMIAPLCQDCFNPMIVMS